ncbi:lipase I [Rhizoctonia solani AG-1 IA]|uniref:Lipase I n=1 Tax=Thanatephorus cucumeris (strain AG1-IA) TaxID=983506 RepID=L8WP17_THACA|nr:lipase I [Rhizoctonia solani AG-1 IA]
MVDDIKEGGGRRGWSWSTRGSQLNMMQLLGVTLLLWLSVIAKCSSVTITNPSGVSYVGVRNTTTKQDIFYGIPYAQPPVGPLRFKPPQAWAPASNHTLVNATANRPVCIQSTPIDDSPVSEDCLYLRKPNNITMKLPVMVWIYGGGFLNGSTLWYPGEAILNTAFQLGKPVIYVAMNYRLGIYGFPPGKQSEAAGALNLGLKDQRLALEWVKKNIGLFGGDVMIFGESAGAMSVAYQMMYKDGKHGGVFRTALMESGAPSTKFGYVKRSELQSVQGEARSSYNSTEKILRHPPAPTGPSVPRSIPVLQNTWPQNYELTSHYGTANLDEGTIFTTNPETTEDVVAFLTAQLPGLTFGITNKTAVNQLLKYYPAHPSAGSPYNTGNNTFGKASQYKRAASIIGDLVFDAPRRDFLQVATKLGVSAWSYQWAQAGLDLPEFGAAHSFDLAFVFQQRWEGMTQSLIDLSVAMIDYWITLAYKLDPGATANPNRAAWPKYGTVGKSLKLEAGNITVIGDDFRVGGMNYIQDNLLT